MSHEWGHHTTEMDLAKCLRCGIVRSNAQIATTPEVIPPCRKPK